MKYLLSIVVPLKTDNYVYLKAIVDKICCMNSNEMELVIHDNSINNIDIVEYLKIINNPNIKYIYTSETITMSENFELSIKQSSGEYICMLGADDNISSSIVDVARYLSQKSIESAIFNKASYGWPGIQYRAHQNRPCLVINRTRGNIYNIDIKKEYYKLLKNGMVSIGKLPEPYHGLIRRDVFDKVFEMTGKYILGACPDMAMAVALSKVVKSHVYIDSPITISGQSYNSAGGKGARGEHKGSLKNKNFLPEDIEKNWPSCMPKLWTGPTIYVDSLYSVLIKLKNEEDLKKLNVAATYANIEVFFPEYSEIIKPFMSSTSLAINKKIYSIFIIINRIVNYARNTLISNFHITGKAIYFNISSSFLASNLIDEYIVRKGVNKFTLKKI